MKDLLERIGMTKEKQGATALALAMTVIVLALVIIMGWVLSMPFFINPIPSLPAIKFNAALCALLLGMALGMMANRVRTMNAERIDVGMPLIVMLVILLMLPSMLAMMFNTQTGFEQFFLQLLAEKGATTAAGRVPFAAAATFVMTALFFFLMFLRPGTEKYAKPFGALLAIAGIAAIIGYAVNMPALHYQLNETDYGMSIYTAIMFVMIGTGLALLQKPGPEFVAQ
ncbi:Uncharacterised protein [Candidatus Gugararchaeum adminiculabundum]|nr:Uncharacterised protein [Candidatus Gugararchaeum adminiculabundum]